MGNHAQPRKGASVAGTVGRGAARLATRGAAAAGRGSARLAKRSLKSGYAAGRRKDRRG